MNVADSSSPSHPFGPSPAGVLLLTEGPRVVCIGVRDFAEALWIQQVPCVYVDWFPGEEDDESTEISRLLDRLL